jgi:prevent-host-death family protein
MTTVGAFEAKTHFSRLLERVVQGEEIVITLRGRPVARLVPATGAEEGRIEQAIATLKSLREGASLGGFSWKTLRDEGRR